MNPESQPSQMTYPSGGTPNHMVVPYYIAYPNPVVNGSNINYTKKHPPPHIPIIMPNYPQSMYQQQYPQYIYHPAMNHQPMHHMNVVHVPPLPNTGFFNTNHTRLILCCFNSCFNRRKMY